ncbi:hypothetical protein GCM10017620_32000 [Brevundimonas intermedia]|uniref:Uncharacterized protein n=1 Tax=Brevundimonas intermedia TaxID=74315 RepID=A0ABQ5TCB3_9CAUL|nr:hypothetical protein [Brevundimonas intermedia]GLK50226.1 hypothetical protein GCM10017620_32000 [Brevundimonas intermedia]
MKIPSIAGQAGLALALMLGAPALAQSGPAQSGPSPTAPRATMIDRLINSPFVQNWYTWGLTPNPTPRDAQGVTGGKALTIDVQKAGDPWSVGAVMTNSGAIKTGDVLLLGVWVRADRLPEGQTETRMATMILEGETEPKVTLAQASDVAVGPQWKMIYASGVAAKDFAPGESKIILQMGQAVHRLELGPALLFNFGPDYDRSRLPQNP